MSWLQEFQADILSLRQARADWLVTELVKPESLEELKDVFAPFIDGSLDPGDLETVFDRFWSKYKSMQIEAVKKEVAILRRLTPLYERLEQASEQEWEDYVRMSMRAEWHRQEPFWRKLIEGFSSQEKPASETGIESPIPPRRPP